MRTVEGACREKPARRQGSCRMRMCTVDIKERACAGKAGGAEVGPSENAHAHFWPAAGWGGALGKGAGSSAAALAHLPGEGEGAAAEN